MHPLDRPAWTSLSGPHAPMSTGGPLARRYDADVSPFAATADDDPAALAALAGLLQPGEQVFLVQRADIVLPPGLVFARRGRCVQMVATRTLHEAAPDTGLALRALGDADAAEMLQLALLTEPGPFLARTHTMGCFRGVRAGGELVAMAGERLRPAGFVEVSGVCTHPEWRGKGLARRLSAAVATGIQAGGHTPFLHAWTSNRAAIDLYHSLGFEQRCEMDVAVLERPASP